MWNIILKVLFKVISSEVAKTAIGYGVNKLLESQTDGVTRDIAEVMIDGIAKSKSNPTKDDMFKEALQCISSDLKVKEI